MAEAEVLEAEVVDKDFEEWRSYLPEAERAKGIEANRREYEWAKEKARRDDLPAIRSADAEPMSLVRLAIERNVDVEVLERLVALQEHVMERNAKSAFIAALARFQDECPPLYKSGKVDFGGKTGGRVAYQFAPLEEIVRVIRPSLSANGLSFSHDSEELEGERLRITCIVRHVDGHSESASFTCSTQGIASPGMNAIQQAGAAVSYGRRYSLIQALGLVTEADTDALYPQAPAPGPPKSRVKLPARLEPAVAAEYADQARQAILENDDPEIIGRALLTLGKLYARDEQEVRFLVKRSGATQQKPLTQEQALELVNTLQAQYEGERAMEREDAEWQPEMPSEPEIPPPSSTPEPGEYEKITDGMRKKLFATMFERAGKLGLRTEKRTEKHPEGTPDIESLHFALRVAMRVDHVEDIPKSNMQTALQFIEGWKP